MKHGQTSEEGLRVQGHWVLVQVKKLPPHLSFSLLIIQNGFWVCFLFILMVPEVEPEPSYMLSKRSTTNST